MMSLTFGLFTQVSGSGPLGPLVKCSGNWFKFLNEDICYWVCALYYVKISLVRPEVYLIPSGIKFILHLKL